MWWIRTHTKATAGRVVPDHDNNIDDDLYKELQYEEGIAFDNDEDIVKEVTPNEDDSQYDMPEGTPSTT
jgi:hypothetical protein